MRSGTVSKGSMGTPGRKNVDTLGRGDRGMKDLSYPGQHSFKAKSHGKPSDSGKPQGGSSQLKNQTNMRKG